MNVEVYINQRPQPYRSGQLGDNGYRIVGYRGAATLNAEDYTASDVASSIAAALNQNGWGVIGLPRVTFPSFFGWDVVFEFEINAGNNDSAEWIRQNVLATIQGINRSTIVSTFPLLTNASLTVVSDPPPTTTSTGGSPSGGTTRTTGSKGTTGTPGSGFPNPNAAPPDPNSKFSWDNVMKDLGLAGVGATTGLLLGGLLFIVLTRK